MPPRRRSAPASESLTSDDLAALTTALATGKRATVYLREGMSGLGLAEGASARVVSIDGTTLTVSPTGVDDELPFEADELRMSKVAPPKPEAAKPKRPGKPKPAQAAVPVQSPPRPRAAQTSVPPNPSPGDAPPKPAPKPATKRAATKKATASVSVTIFGTADNEWSVSLVRGARKPQRSRPVAPEAVDAAVRSLGDDSTREAVTTLLNAAREEAQRRVEQLSRELDEARQALAALDTP